MANIGFATLSVIPSLKGIEGAISSQLGGPLAAASSKAGAQSATAVGGGFTSKIGGAMKGATLPFIGIGVAAIASATSVQNAQNTILRTTGASGKAADGLLKSFNNVAKGSAASFDTVASTLAEVSQRTGLVGKPLEGLTSQIVTFNRITKDAPIGVKDLTQTLAGFKIPAAQSGVALDKLFTISQKTGVPLAELNSTLGSSGAILRQFRLPLDQSASLLAKLDKAGVPASAAMGGLKKAFTTFAKAGEDPKTALIGVLGQIDALVKAGNNKGAQQLGAKIFGARGVGLVDAAIQGKLAIGDLTKTVPNLGKGIAATAKSTSTMSGKLGVLKNNATLALAQLGGPLLDTATVGLATIVPIVSKLASGFGSLPGPVKGVAVSLVALGAVAGPITKLATGVAKFGKGIFTAGKFLYNAASSTLSFAKNVAVSTFNIARNVAAFVAQKVAAFAAAAAQKAMAAAQWLLNAAMDANPIGLIVVGIAALAAGFVLAYKHITPFRNAVDFLGRAFVSAFGWVKDHWPLLLAILTGPIGIAVLVVSKNFDRIKGFVSGALDFVRRNWATIGAVLLGPIGLAVLAISRNWETIKAGFSTVVGFIGRGAARIVQFFTGLPREILGAVGDLGNLLYDAGRDLVEGMLNGIKAGWDKVTGFLGDSASHLPGVVKTVLGIHSPSKVFAKLGSQTIEGFEVGMRKRAVLLTATASTLSDQVANAWAPKKKLSFDLAHEMWADPSQIVAASNFAKAVKAGKVSLNQFLKSNPNSAQLSAFGKLTGNADIAHFLGERAPAAKRPAGVASTFSPSAADNAFGSGNIIINLNGNGDAYLRRVVDEEVIPALQRATHKKRVIRGVVVGK